MFGRVTKKHYTCGLRTGHDFKLHDIYLVEEQGLCPNTLITHLNALIAALNIPLSGIT
jgi:hypothetical protein